ncbi:MAG: pyrroline-5-carboxylate reductase [Zetaproteobacteria bacterium]|nr:MAG: pyrroline-5-carboxylate reductase [Zetaproteobacteria bacterium]
MKHEQIAFIGGGNMAEAMIAGLVRAGHEASAIRVREVRAERVEALQESYGIGVCASLEALSEASIVVLAVKPQQVAEALAPLAGWFDERHTLVSIVAGLPLAKLRAMLGDRVHIVRAMPNTPALVGAGMAALFSDSEGEHREHAEYLLRACGEALWVEREKDMHAVTAVSGSGPAYFFLLAELLQGAGQTLGLSSDVAAKLATQTALGAGKMLVESGRPASELRQQVTSPGGTTQAALDLMLEEGMPELVRKAVAAAAKRSAELGR